MTTYYRYDNAGEYVLRSEYEVQRATECGVRLTNGKLIIHSHRKRFAYPTDELAREAFLARKRRQKAILLAQLQNIDAILERADPFENSRPYELEDFGELLL